MQIRAEKNCFMHETRQSRVL